MLAFACLFGNALLAQPAVEPSLDAAAAAYQQGRMPDAARILGLILKNHPDDAGALVLMGAVLDAGQHYADAEAYYSRALQIAPASPQVLNNAGNHYLAAGDRSRAREFYLKAVAIDPHHVNANLQLAHIET